MFYIGKHILHLKAFHKFENMPNILEPLLHENISLFLKRVLHLRTCLKFSSMSYFRTSLKKNISI